MSLDFQPPPKINDCASCYGTGVQGWTNGEDYEVNTCDQCEGKVTRQ